MSVLRTSEIQNPSSNTVNITLNSNGTFTGPITKSSLPSGSILQVVSTTKTDTFTTTSLSLVDVTGMSASITPSSASSKIFVMFSGFFGQNTLAREVHTSLLRDSTVIISGDAAGSRTGGSGYAEFNDTDEIFAWTITHLDSPNTTSSITYKLQMRASGAGTACINRTGADTDSADFPRLASTITLFEVAA